LNLKIVITLPIISLICRYTNLLNSKSNYHSFSPYLQLLAIFYQLFFSFIAKEGELTKNAFLIVRWLIACFGHFGSSKMFSKRVEE